MKKYFISFVLLFIILAVSINSSAFYEENTTIALRAEDITQFSNAEEEWRIFELQNPGVNTSKLIIDGDIRYRLWYDHNIKECSQDYRLRLGFDVALDEQADMYFRLSTGTQQIDELQQDSATIDVATLTITPNILPDLELHLGKNELPFQIPGDSKLLFDVDVFRGEGIAANYFVSNNTRTVSVFSTAGYFNDVMSGGQIGIQVGDEYYVVGAVGYYDFHNGDAYREAMAEIGYGISSIYGDYAVTVDNSIISWLSGIKLGIDDITLNYNYRDIDKKSQMANVDFPTPAGPENNRCGMFFWATNAFTRATISFWPLISEKSFGLYFSVHIAWSSFIDNRKKL